eukprot:TRINITY_DN5429_c2_g1_i2.p1 TRINITY_DN5429_c2_g1~~TRINITY_DN5429_c2_g1_i2.p1  ORF type:complete len:308 (-),score=13.57 TRINITY_DN5429_c2_g1_i2:127-1050(-)
MRRRGEDARSGGENGSPNGQGTNDEEGGDLKRLKSLEGEISEGAWGGSDDDGGLTNQEGMIERIQQQQQKQQQQARKSHLQSSRIGANAMDVERPSVKDEEVDDDVFEEILAGPYWADHCIAQLNVTTSGTVDDAAAATNPRSSTASGSATDAPSVRKALSTDEGDGAAAAAEAAAAIGAAGDATATEESDEEEAAAARGALPPGFRFRPTDEELLFFYLRRRVLNRAMRWHVIADVDLYKLEPWELPGECERALVGARRQPIQRTFVGRPVFSARERGFPKLQVFECTNVATTPSWFSQMKLHRFG